MEALIAKRHDSGFITNRTRTLKQTLSGAQGQEWAVNVGMGAGADMEC